jgi:hypothetical protein
VLVLPLSVTEKRGTLTSPSASNNKASMPLESLAGQVTSAPLSLAVILGSVTLPSSVKRRVGPTTPLLSTDAAASSLP